MKVVAWRMTTDKDDDRYASVVLRPWFLWCFLGAPDLNVLLLKDDHGEWRSAITGRKIDDMPHGALIRRTLETLPGDIVRERPVRREAE